MTPSPVKPYGQRPHLKDPVKLGSQGTPGKQGESAQVTRWDGSPTWPRWRGRGTGSPPLGWPLRTVETNTPVPVWFCGVAVVLLSVAETLLTVETVASGRVLLSEGRLAEVGDDEEEEEEEEEEEVVGLVSLLEFDLVMWIWPPAPLVTVPWPVKHWGVRGYDLKNNTNINTFLSHRCFYPYLKCFPLTCCCTRSSVSMETRRTGSTGEPCGDVGAVKTLNPRVTRPPAARRRAREFGPQEKLRDSRLCGYNPRRGLCVTLETKRRREAVTGLVFP